ncbi:MAG TPA: transporter [Planctomycetaceae bacterium]|nr:transporter [Planctomycetaceae bacterium]
MGPSLLRWICCTGLLVTTHLVSASAFGRDVGDLFEDADDCGTSFVERLKSPFQPSEEDSLQTDRPGFTEASSVVGRGRILLEGGFTHVQDRDATTRATAYAFPQNLLRIGLSETVELRVVWDAGYLRTREVDRVSGTVTRQAGSTDILLGTKMQFSEQQGWIPETAVISTLSIQSGSDEFRTSATEPRFNFLYGWDLNEKFNLAGSTGIGFLAEIGNKYTAAHQSIIFSTTITEKLGIFQEWFVLVFEGTEASFPEHYLDGGITYQLTPNTQIDWWIGWGLNDHADDLFTGTGYAFRW